MKKLLMEFSDMGVKVFIQWIATEEAFEVSSGGNVLGFANTVAEAKTVARDWFEELMA